MASSTSVVSGGREKPLNSVVDTFCYETSTRVDKKLASNYSHVDSPYRVEKVHIGCHANEVGNTVGISIESRFLHICDFQVE